MIQADKLITLDQAAERSISRRALPASEQRDYRSDLKHYQHVYDPTLHVLEFRDCLVNRSGFIKLSSGEVIADIGYRERVERSVGELNAPASEPLRIDEPVILIAGHSNYYHWHLNWLPRLALADRFDDLRAIKPLITNFRADYMRDSLEAVTGRNSRDSIMLGFQVLHLSRVFIPTMFLNPLHAPFVLRSYEHLRQPRQAGAGKRLYISRSQAANRHVLNEDEVTTLLSDYGFETVISENYSYQQQISLFSQAAHIVGTHGAGLTNVLFCYPGFSMIELFNQFRSKVYHSLCAAMGATHYWNLASEKIIPPAKAANPRHLIKNADFFVDIHRLRRKVEFILSSQ